jgi:hypothetical protein
MRSPVSKSHRRNRGGALGDALLEGHYVEVKHATSPTLNQAERQYITLVGLSVREGECFPPHTAVCSPP